MAAVLRHRLGLEDKVRLSVYDDVDHRLFPGTRYTRATGIQLSHGREGYAFIATYEASEPRLTFSVIAPSPDCLASVPRVTIDNLADFGDWLLGARSANEAQQFRTSPVHRTGCPVRGN
ncbi:hypothetical protein AB0D66_28395 [Streptomyces sp. NPDC048270]|uniref:hypothetical protein n=1 Tax=Streptomyces sp. NPDC048270 TaxID=3154615 RepID=UPI0034075E09